MDVMTTEGVQNTYTANIHEPRISARGNIIGSRLSCSGGEEMRPEEGRRLAAALSRAADQAEALDSAAIPHLKAFQRAVEDLAADGADA